MSRDPLAVLREAVAFSQSERGASPADIDRDQAEDEALALVDALVRACNWCITTDCSVDTVKAELREFVYPFTRCQDSEGAA